MVYYWGRKGVYKVLCTLRMISVINVKNTPVPPKVYILAPFQRHVVMIVDFIDDNRFLEC